MLFKAFLFTVFDSLGLMIETIYGVFTKDLSFLEKFSYFAAALTCFSCLIIVLIIFRKFIF